MAFAHRNEKAARVPSPPLICDRCQDPLPPYRWANTGWPAFAGQCECEVPKDPVAISEKVGDLARFVTRDERPTFSAPTEAELNEAAERADAGNGLAFPHLFEQHGKAAEVCEKHAIDHDTASAVGRELLSARQAIYNAAKATPLKPQLDLHLAFNALLNEIDRIAGEVAERWEGT